MMVVRENDRSDSKAIHERLNSMHTKMMRDADYYQTPCKPSRVGKTQQPLKAIFKILPLKKKQAGEV
jgi:hypothetical protein